MMILWSSTDRYLMHVTEFHNIHELLMCFPKLQMQVKNLDIAKFSLIYLWHDKASLLRYRTGSLSSTRWCVNNVTILTEFNNPLSIKFAFFFYLFVWEEFQLRIWIFFKNLFLRLYIDEGRFLLAKTSKN